jgi:hypothetical protein
MQQLLHLLIVNPDRRECLAALHSQRWLLPIASCTERARAGPLIARWLAEHGLPGQVIGQWLGRVSAANDAMDWLVIVDARGVRSDPAPAGMYWTPFEELQSSDSLLDYQQWALRKAVLHDLPSVPGPFGSMTWLDEVRDWLNVVAGPLTGPPICYKATPYEVVLGIAAASGTVYFKGLAEDRVAESTLTSTLANELPDSFAPTLALEQRAGGAAWWVTANCAGTTLAADPTRERAALVAVNLARTQRHLSSRTAGLTIIDAGLSGAAAWGSGLLAAHSDADSGDGHDAALARVCRTVNDADLPHSWIPLDLDPGNVLIDDEAVRFIDLDRSRVGAAPLSLSLLLRRLRRIRSDSASPQWVEVMRAYEQPWTPHLDLREAWSDLEMASVLVESHLSWQELCRKAARGEVYGALDLAATRAAQMLARALDGRRGGGSAHGS